MCCGKLPAHFRWNAHRPASLSIDRTPERARLRQESTIALAPDFGEAFEGQPSGCAHPCAKHNLVAERGRFRVRERTVLRLHPKMAPVTAAILPLIGKSDDMVAKARSLYEDLRRRHSVEYDDNGAIGRRYRRQDEIGTPWAFTIDEQTLEDDTVTVRDRDSLAQERLPIAGVGSWLEDALERDWVSPKAS